MKVKFITDATAITDKGPETLFEAGDVQDLNDASADRWIRRGVAELFSETPATKKTSKKKTKK